MPALLNSKNIFWTVWEKDPELATIVCRNIYLADAFHDILKYSVDNL